MKKVLSFIKNLIYRLFGKLRWYLLGMFILALIIIIPQTFPYLQIKINGVTDEDKNAINETRFEDVQSFSINENGTLAAICNVGYNGYTAVYDIESKQTSYSFTNFIFSDPEHKDMFAPSNLVITDEDSIYAVRTYDRSVTDNADKKDCIIKLTKKYEFVNKVCDIDCDISKEDEGAEISNLHYFAGYITFGIIKNDGVLLYRINTKTDDVEVSHEYSNDEDGTFTVNVIPIDDAFLFVRSDGEVYKVSFDEPLSEVIYHFSDEDPFFTDATIYGGELYVFDENKPSKIYQIKDSTAEEIFDLNTADGLEDREISRIDSYTSDDGIPTLAICLSDGLLTFSEGQISEIDTLQRIDNHYFVYIFKICTFLFELFMYAAIINLIIRRKTIFYKQIMATVPLFTIIAVILGMNIYSDSFENSNQKVRDELGIITYFGAKELEDYDFSGLLEVGDTTGSEYHKLQNKLSEISTGHTEEWSDNYIFSVIYHIDGGRAAVLAGEDGVDMPMFTEEDFVIKDYQPSDGVFFSENIKELLSSDSKTSGISAYYLIKNTNGNIYLKVTTDNKSYAEEREELFVIMIAYVTLVIIFFISTNLLISLYIRRMIKKATGVVKRISDGDLSARISYKSKDEMGDICNEVNAMGQNLEKLFEEKDKTERFYYKFVPEQFRTLLGKEEFTDLELGDSDSRELTVLFLDIRAFSKMSEKMTTKENFEFVNIIYGTAGPIIRDNNGFIDKYIGDAIMALFESADDAVRSGIELYKAIVLNPETSQKLGVEDINIGIGIHTGMAQIGIVGETERLSGTVISDTVNLSSRFESLTKQYKTAILISKDTVDKLTEKDSLELRYLGSVQAAGVDESKEIYEVLDCLPDEEKKKRSGNKDVLAKAIKYFSVGNRDDALDILNKLKVSGKNDYVTDLYLNLITETEDKDGIFVFKNK